jgi:hypothetical protein
MTICIAVSVQDGIVFAADSAATMISTDASGNSVATNVYRHGNKVFNLFKGLPICAMTAGMASIGNAGIHTLAKDLRKKLRNSPPYTIDPTSYTIGEVAKNARSFLYDDSYLKCPQVPAPHSLEFWIGGFSAGADIPELWKVAIINGNSDQPVRLNQILPPSSAYGIWWGGAGEPIQRLLVGFDQELENALSSAGMPKPDMVTLMGIIKSKSGRYLSDPRMPIQDAIDLAQYLVDTAKGYYRFLQGADVVGGDTDVAVVTRHERFKWVKRKHFYPQHLNIMETDHDHG